MEQSIEDIYHNLMYTYLKTNKIGRCKPTSRYHATRVAWAVAKKLHNKNKEQYKPKTYNTPVVRKGQSPCSPVECCQLQLFS